MSHLLHKSLIANQSIKVLVKYQLLSLTQEFCPQLEWFMCEQFITELSTVETYFTAYLKKRVEHSSVAVWVLECDREKVLHEPARQMIGIEYKRQEN